MHLKWDLDREWNPAIEGALQQREHHSRGITTAEGSPQQWEHQSRGSTTAVGVPQQWEHYSEKKKKVVLRYIVFHFEDH